MILGPDDPRAITGEEREAAIANTEKWGEVLGIKPMSKKERAEKEELEDAILKFLGSWKDKS